jgi:hypothetical protein
MVNVFFVLLFLVTAIIYHYCTTSQMDDLLNEVYEEFEFVGISDEINGKISIVSSYPSPIRDSKMCPLIRSRDFGNKMICTLSDKESKFRLGDVIEAGDSISKVVNSYIITVYKKQKGDTSIYEFELCDDHGWPLESK